MANKSFEQELLEQRAIARIQAMVLRLMEVKKIPRSDLAERMGVSMPRISQILSGDPENISVRKAVALFHALGEQLQFTCDGIEQLDHIARDRCALRATLGDRKQWRVANGNENCAAQEPGVAVA